MKEFIEKLIGRLEEEKNKELLREDNIDENGMYNDCEEAYEDGQSNGRYQMCVRMLKFVNQLAEEYKHCIKSSCSNCETYDNEKHYCPKWCDVIKGTVEEIKENHDNDFCEWQEISVGGITAVKEPHRMKLFNYDHEQQFCQYCGKKIRIAPYQPKGE